MNISSLLTKWSELESDRCFPCSDKPKSDAIHQIGYFGNNPKFVITISKSEGYAIPTKDLTQLELSVLQSVVQQAIAEKGWTYVQQRDPDSSRQEYRYRALVYDIDDKGDMRCVFNAIPEVALLEAYLGYIIQCQNLETEERRIRLLDEAISKAKAKQNDKESKQRLYKTLKYEAALKLFKLPFSDQLIELLAPEYKPHEYQNKTIGVCAVFTYDELRFEVYRQQEDENPYADTRPAWICTAWDDSKTGGSTINEKSIPESEQEEMDQELLLFIGASRMVVF